MEELDLKNIQLMAKLNICQLRKTLIQNYQK